MAVFGSTDRGKTFVSDDFAQRFATYHRRHGYTPSTRLLRLGDIYWVGSGSALARKGSQ
jgi:hypothetical protein